MTTPPFLVGTALVVAFACSRGLAQAPATNPNVQEQAARPAAAAHDFDKWEKEIAAYEAADRANPPPKGGVLFIGSSTIRLWTTLAEDFPDHKVINRGIGGCPNVVSPPLPPPNILPPLPPPHFLFPRREP